MSCILGARQYVQVALSEPVRIKDGWRKKRMASDVAEQINTIEDWRGRNNRNVRCTLQHAINIDVSR